LHQLVVAILDETARLQGDYLTAMRGLMTALLARHSRLMIPTKNPAGSKRDSQAQLLSRLGDVLHYINQHYTEELTIDQLVDASGASKSTLQRDMIDFTGMAPMQYIHHLRMKRAALLLTDGSPVADVAFDVGYNTLSSFNRHFLKEYGMSPTQWTKNHMSASAG
jgi:AraC-like DNA-binding protein